MERLRGKVAIVTGGAGGIGHAFARGLASEGARVVIADMDEAGAGALASELGGDALAFKLDVTSVESTQELARVALERFGRIDILVNTAAIYVTLERKPFAEIDLAEWNRIFAVDLTGSALCARAVLPAMKQQGAGVIINMGSVNTHLVPEGRTHYNAAKAAVEALTRTLARLRIPSPYGRGVTRANARVGVRVLDEDLAAIDHQDVAGDHARVV